MDSFHSPASFYCPHIIVQISWINLFHAYLLIPPIHLFLVRANSDHFIVQFVTKYKGLSFLISSLPLSIPLSYISVSFLFFFLSSPLFLSFSPSFVYLCSLLPNFYFSSSLLNLLLSIHPVNI